MSTAVPPSGEHLPCVALSSAKKPTTLDIRPNQQRTGRDSGAQRAIDLPDLRPDCIGLVGPQHARRSEQRYDVHKIARYLFCCHSAVAQGNSHLRDHIPEKPGFIPLRWFRAAGTLQTVSLTFRHVWLSTPRSCSLGGNWWSWLCPFQRPH